MKNRKVKVPRTRPVASLVESGQAGLSIASRRKQGEKQKHLQTWEDEGGSVHSLTADHVVNARDVFRGPFMIPGRWPPLPMLPAMRLPELDSDFPVPK